MLLTLRLMKWSIFLSKYVGVDLGGISFSGHKSQTMMKINTDIEKKICDRVRDGQNIRQISREIGIPRSTLYNWLRRGRAEKRGVYRNFFMSFKRAKRERWATLIRIAAETTRFCSRHYTSYTPKLFSPGRERETVRFL